MVSVLFQTDGARQPHYLSFRECMDYKEDPLRRDMRPSFPYIFELGRLDVNYKLERLPTVGRNSQVCLPLGFRVVVVVFNEGGDS